MPTFWLQSTMQKRWLTSSETSQWVEEPYESEVTGCRRGSDDAAHLQNAGMFFVCRLPISSPLPLVLNRSVLHILRTELDRGWTGTSKRTTALMHSRAFLAYEQQVFHWLQSGRVLYTCEKNIQHLNMALLGLLSTMESASWSVV